MISPPFQPHKKRRALLRAGLEQRSNNQGNPLEAGLSKRAAPNKMNSETKTVNPDEANAIQTEWMELDSNAPKPEKDRVFRLMRKLPQSYISQSDSGSAQVMVQGMPAHAFPEPVESAERRARAMGVQTALRWNTKGEWIAEARPAAPARPWYSPRQQGGAL